MASDTTELLLHVFLKFQCLLLVKGRPQMNRKAKQLSEIFPKFIEGQGNSLTLLHFITLHSLGLPEPKEDF